MIQIVPDVSVAVKWILPQGEQLREQAQALLRRFLNAEVTFIVPDIFWAELGNALWKAVRVQRMSLRDARSGMEQLTSLDLHSVSSRRLLLGAFTIAHAHRRTVYDSLYVALAVKVKSEMITADERLANTLAGYAPVKWLGAI